ncbi:hypothetical protein Bca52824_077838 [Brassica carinata]|uniref:Uncharacterized protein n=1 Tax=Brassica carinata TaxID=52824 RepID=A0A8X7PUC8_BRACI|nr:hypothetical protein Bca52824_077838 [Brassica carinata]
MRFEQEDIRLTIARVASRHGNYLLPLLMPGKNVNQQNVNQRRSPDDAEREAREMVLSQILFSHSLERKCLEDVILRAAQMEQIVEKTLHYSVCFHRFVRSGLSWAVCDLWDYFPSVSIFMIWHNLFVGFLFKLLMPLKHNIFG